MSVCRGFAQRVTRNFVTLSATARIYTYANLTTGTGVTNIGDVVTLDTAANLDAYVEALPAAGAAVDAAANVLLEDLGKTVRVGLAGVNSELLIFRLVKAKKGTIVSGGDVTAAANFGYVLVETDIGLDVAIAAGSPDVLVARV